jgi:RNA polymerase sigma-54 factor
MKHSLQLKLSQHLTLTPQLQQSIRLLQLSTVELNQEVDRFLQENPLLEREDDAPEEVRLYSAPGTSSTVEVKEAPEEAATNSSAVDGVEWTDGESFGGGGGHAESDESDYPQIAAESGGLRDHLFWQLNVSQLLERDKRLVALLIDALDDDGYLTQSLEEIAAMIPEELELDPIELQIALNYLKTFDPPGVGALNLAECLAFQLAAFPEATPRRDAALAVVTLHLDSLASRDYAKLRKLLQCDEQALREIQQLIVSLNPKPGARFSSEQARYVVPDVVVKKVKGLWRASLHPDAMPKLKINRVYADILHRSRDAGYQQMSGQLQEAKWLIKNVQQRFDTILRVSQAIVDRQRHFFEHGEVAMRPLVLREIAETLGLHESTVSRVTTQKFMLTARGIFELKYFFGSHVATDSGGACSATAIRALIKQLVGAEDAKRPLSDSQISEILGQQGITVARRTIAKYREALQIPPVNLRKSI